MTIMTIGRPVMIDQDGKPRILVGCRTNIPNTGTAGVTPALVECRVVGLVEFSLALSEPVA